jgi:hypothetical protein
MPELTQAVTTIASRPSSPVGPAPVFAPRGRTAPAPAPLQAAATCDTCSCHISRCSGSLCCY